MAKKKAKKKATKKAVIKRKRTATSSTGPKMKKR